MNALDLKKQYFSLEPSISEAELNQWISHFQDFFRTAKYPQFSKKGQIITLTLEALTMCFGNEFITLLDKDPSTVFASLSFAAHLVFSSTPTRHGSLYHVQITDAKNTASISSLDPTYINTLICINGIVSTIYPISSALQGATLCFHCGRDFFLSSHQPKCPECYRSSFIVIDRDPIITKTQRIEISSIGSLNSTLLCILHPPFLGSDKLFPGQILSLSGVLLSQQRSDSVFSLVLDVNYIEYHPLPLSLSFLSTSLNTFSTILSENPEFSIKSIPNMYKFPFLTYSLLSFGINVSDITRATILLTIISENFHLLLESRSPILQILQEIIPHSVLQLSNDPFLKSFDTKITKNSIKGGAYVMANGGVLLTDTPKSLFCSIKEAKMERIGFHCIPTLFSSITVVPDLSKVSKKLLPFYDIIIPSSLSSSSNSTLSAHFLSLSSRSSPFTSFSRENFQNLQNSEKENSGNQKQKRALSQVRTIFPIWEDQTRHLIERLELKQKSVEILKSIFFGFDEQNFKKEIAKYKSISNFVWTKESIQYLRDMYSTTQENMKGDRFLNKIKALSESLCALNQRTVISETDVKEATELILWWNDENSSSCANSANFGNKMSRKKVTKLEMIREFMKEFRRIARYHTEIRGNAENGTVTEEEMKEIAQIIGAIDKFGSFEALLQQLSTNSFVLMTAPHIYREGNPLI